MSSDRYKSLGASATKEGIHQALKNAGLDTEAQYFAHLLPDIAGDKDFKSFIHADGAGTKSVVAYLRYMDTNDPEVFKSLAQDALVMNLDDVFCLGRPSSMMLSNAIGRNARLVPDEAIEAIISGYTELADSLKTLGVDVALGGGETADCGDVVRTLLVDAVLAGRIETQKLLSPSNIRSGDAIIALSSTGQASYEDQANSGIGSNGLTLARHCLLNSSYREKYPECVDDGIDTSISYMGPFSCKDTPAGLEMNIGEALASPTRTYAPLLQKLFNDKSLDIRAVIHLTGGAHTKVIRFANSKRFVKDNLFPTPEIFKLIQTHGEVSWEEMYKVFNMGQRMELYVPQSNVEQVVKTASEFSIDARKVGHVEDSSDSQSEVIVRSEHGDFTYRL